MLFQADNASADERARLRALLSGTVLFALSFQIFDSLAPLWATNEVGFTPAGWAQLRGVRMTGTFLGMVFLGILAEKIGSKQMAFTATLVAGLTLILMQFVPRPALFGLIPIYGALVSTIFVNFNALAQQVSRSKQEKVNSIYRGTFAGCGIFMPVVALSSAQAIGNYWSLMLVSAGFLMSAGALIRSYPLNSQKHGHTTLRSVLTGYATMLKMKKFTAYVVIEQVWHGAVAAVAAFAALHFTKDLNVIQSKFGLIATCAAGLSFLFTLSAGAIAERISCGRLLALTWTLSGCAAMVLGIVQDVTFATVAFLCFIPLSAMSVVPASITISRMGQSVSQTTAFTTHKVFQAGAMALFMNLFGQLEPILGMAGIIKWGGITGMSVGIFWFLFGRKITANF